MVVIADAEVEDDDKQFGDRLVAAVEKEIVHDSQLIMQSLQRQYDEFPSNASHPGTHVDSE